MEISVDLQYDSSFKLTVLSQDRTLSQGCGYKETTAFEPVWNLILIVHYQVLLYLPLTNIVSSAKGKIVLCTGMNLAIYISH